jgi:hypothetical protein
VYFLGSAGIQLAKGGTTSGHFQTLALLEAASDIPFSLIDFGIGLSVGMLGSIGALVALFVVL